MIAAEKSVHSGAVGVERAGEAQYYRADIDGLRGIAVITVVAFHAFPVYVTGGYIGVDVFFVVSGFLISGIILRQLHQSTFTLSQFYVRRILRIFPALIVVLAATLVLGSFILLPDEFTELGKHLASASVFVSNFTLWQESGYFDRAAELKPLLHLWSLGVEEQFYLLWPLLLFFLWMKRERSTAREVFLLSLASFALAMILGRTSSTASFYLPFSRFWELGLGCLLAIIQHSPSARWRSLMESTTSTRMHSVLGALGISLIIIAAFALDADTPFPGLATLIPTIGAACIILARPDAWFQRRVMGSRGLLLLGLISYPMYLWHWPLLSFARILEADEPNVSARIVAILISAFLAWLTFKYLERPARARRRRRDAIAFAVALAILGAAGLFIFSNHGFPERFRVDVSAIRPEPRINALCRKHFPEEIDFNYCKSTSHARPHTLFLGDSHAQAVYDAVATVTGSDRPLMLLARGGCPPLLNVELHYITQQGCSQMWSKFARYVAEVQPAVVVLVGGSTDLLDPSVTALESSERWRGSRQAAFKEGLRELVTALQRTSRVIYVTEFPPFPTAPSCFLRPLRLPGTQCTPRIDRGYEQARTAEFDRIIRELQAELPELEVIHSLAVLCDQTHCTQRLTSGDIIYRDEEHLSRAGGQYFVQRSGLVELLFEEPR